MLACRAGYVGWAFRGSALQPDVPTVEGYLRERLRGFVKFLSRTDAGVSALDSVALFDTEVHPYAALEMENVWTIGCREVEGVKVMWRWYRYFYPREVEIDRDILRAFEGKRDFTHLSLPEGKDPHREVLEFRSFTIPGFTVFDVVGKSFLRQMVRRMVSAAILCQERSLDPEDVFSGRIRVPPAPPEGLVLVRAHPNTHIPSEKLDIVIRKLEGLWRSMKLRSLVLSTFRLL